MSHAPTRSPSAASLDEARRFDVLREQDNKPLQPPASLRGLVVRGGLGPQHVAEAERELRAALAELRDGGGFPAEERAFFLALLLEHATDDTDRVRELVEPTAAALSTHRFVQYLYSRLANAACRDGDARRARAWLDLCDPRSDDLLADSAYRTSAALLALLDRDYDGALRLLGRRVDDVPIADSHDRFAAILRAHAFERAGELDTSVAHLTQLLNTHPRARETLDRTRAAYRRFALCADSYPRVVAALDAAADPPRRRGLLRLLPFGIHGVVGVGLLIGALVVDDEALTDDGFPLRWFLVAMGAFFILLPVAILGAIRAFGAKRRRILAEGLDAVGEVLSVSATGVRVNDQPRLAIRLRVTEGLNPPYEAEVRAVIPVHQVARLTPGVTVPVKIDPRDRSRVVFVPG